MNKIKKLKLVRINKIVGEHGILPMSRSTWFNGIKAGYYPAGVLISPNVRAWLLSDIEQIALHGVTFDGGANE